MTRIDLACAVIVRRLERLPFVRRVGFTFAAQIYNQFVTVAMQLVQVPLLLSAWGASRYGGWLLLSALPGYLTLSDFGFTGIAKNNMVMAAAAGRQDDMMQTYHSVLALLIGTAAAVGIVAAAALAFVRLDGVFDLGPIGETDGRLVMAALIANVLANQFFLLLCAGVRASGRPAAEVVWGATARLLEAAVTVGAATVGNDVAYAALAILAMRLANLAALAIWLRWAAPQMRLGLAHASFAEIGAMAHPAISFSLLGLSQALTIQGPIVILNVVAGAGATASFATLRTLARLGTSAANLVNYSLTPEYSRLYGARLLRSFARLERIHMVIGALGVGTYGLWLWRMGPWIVTRWTHGQIAVEQPFFGILIVSVGAEMMWSAAFAPLAATNRHVGISYIYVAMTAVWAPLAWAGATFVGPSGVALALSLLNVSMFALLLMRSLPHKYAKATPAGLLPNELGPFTRRADSSHPHGG